MNVKKVIFRGSLGVAGLVVCCAAGLFFVNEAKRSALIKQQQALIAQATYDLDDYRKLGFDEESDVVAVTKLAIDRCYNKIAMLKKARVLMLRPDPVKLARQEQLEQLLRIDRDVAASYKQEISDYINLGVSEHSKVMKFAKDKLVRLVFEIADVESKLQMLKTGNKSKLDVALTEKIQKIIDLNRESIDLYKQEIKDYFNRGLSSTDRRICFARGCIARKVAENNTLAQRLII